MALSNVVLKVTSSGFQAPYFRAFGTITISAAGGTYPTGGFTLPLNQYAIKAQRPPQRVRVTGRAAQAGQTQYNYTYIPGTTLANGKLKIFTGGVELSAATTPTGVTGDTIDLDAEWLGML